MKKRMIALLLVLCLSVGLLSTTVLAAGFQPSSALDLILGAGHHYCTDRNCHVCYPCNSHTCVTCRPDPTWCAACKKYNCTHVKTLTFVTNGGLHMEPVAAVSGTTIDLTKYTPYRMGFEFVGWYTNKHLTAKVTSLVLTKDTVLYAKWKATPVVLLLPFVDIPENSFFYNAVCWGHGHGIVTPNKHFNPNAACTRADMLTFLWRAAGSPESKLTYMPFTDVEPQAYYYEAVQWALEKGITKGTNDLKFRPGNTVTRAEAVTFLYRYSNATGAAKNPFTDVKAEDWFYDAVCWANAYGITAGTSATEFSPYETCTRAQVMTFLYRYFG